MSLGIIICLEFVGQGTEKKRKKEKRKERCRGCPEVCMQVPCRSLAEGQAVHGQGKPCEAWKGRAALGMKCKWRKESLHRSGRLWSSGPAIVEITNKDYVFGINTMPKGKVFVLLLG